MMQLISYSLSRFWCCPHAPLQTVKVRARRGSNQNLNRPLAMLCPFSLFLEVQISVQLPKLPPGISTMSISLCHGVPNGA